MHRDGVSCAAGALVGLLGVVSGFAQAGPTEIIGVAFDGTTYSIDQATGAATLAPMDTGLAGMFVTSLTVDDDWNYWAAAGLGTTHTLVRFGPGGQQSLSITGLATPDAGVFSIDFASDGTMYALVREGIGVNSPFALYQIDTMTGAASKAVDLHIGATIATQLGDMAFADDGTLYAWHRSLISGPDLGLATIDPATGEVSDAGGAVSFNANFLAMDFTPDGRLFGVTSNAQPPSTILHPSALYEFSLVTGAPSLVGDMGQDLDIRGIVVIPAPGGVGLLAGAFVLTSRRRR
ncbi:MAG: hypothetical protein R3B57_03945 [Phycisphaerales bacterium]